MHQSSTHRAARTVLTTGLLASALVGTVVAAPGALAATGATAPTAAAAGAAHHQGTAYRQLLGKVSGPTYLEASVPAAGSYAIEYVTSGGVSFWDTYVNGTELGYVGGSPGTYRTKALPLPAGGQLVRVVGPEGTGTAQVYIVQVS